MRWKRITRRIETGQKSEHSTGFFLFKNLLFGTLFCCILPTRRKEYVLFQVISTLLPKKMLFYHKYVLQVGIRMYFFHKNKSQGNTLAHFINVLKLH